MSLENDSSGQAVYGYNAGEETEGVEMEIQTPLTDRKKFQVVRLHSFVVDVEFSRQLERKLASALKEIEFVRDLLSVAHTEIDSLRAEIRCREILHRAGQ